MANGPDQITRREALRRTALLLGGAVSAPTLAGVLAGCGRDASSAPKVLTGGRQELVATIAEHIIPETDTPGARAAGVDRFVDEMLAAYYPEEERALFLDGLAGVDERARQAHGQDFVDCTPEDQLEILLALDQESFAPTPAPARPAEPPTTDSRERTEGGASPLPPGAETDTIQWIHGDPRRPRRATSLPFFRTMKELTIVGYYTSEVGATQELRHEAVPGRYEGCVPFAQIGRTWAV